ncbi:NUDIX hydrolase [Dyella sp.]|uniref:NUDIX hydrolase n=1 Tax=Dyella sp. TaxID=1869338 RepID=UPI002D770D5F|nr:NUDIX hydrolase [Dyella sp.]HET7333232.1 NUDIX hydrolase [Dyella sp.]
MNIFSWEMIKSEYVLRETDMVVRKDLLRVSGGSAGHSACVLEYPDWVSAFALTENSDVIFVRQYRHGLRKETLEIPGGWKKPEDKDVEAAISRELCEETGYTFERFSLLACISPNPATHSNQLHCFLATGGRRSAAPKFDEDERIEIVLLSLGQVKSLLASGSLLNNGHLTCVFHALMKLGMIGWTR